MKGIVKYLPMVYKVAMMLATAVVIVLLFPHNQQGEHYDYNIGAPWRDADLVAPYDFSVIKSENVYQQEQDIERQKAILYYRYDSTAYHRTIARLEDNPHHLSSGQQRRVKRQIDSIFRIGLLDIPDDMEDISSHRIILLNGNIGSEHRSVDYVNVGDFADDSILSALLLPNIVLDRNRTEMELQSRLSQISYTSRMVYQGERIISKGEMVTVDNARVIKSLEQENDRRFARHFSRFWLIVGQILLAIIAFFALYLFLKNTGHSLLYDNRKITFILLIIVMMSALEALMVRLAPEWLLIVPLCIIPILMRVFFDMRVALYIHITTVVILASLVPNSYEFIFYQLITGMFSIITVRSLEMRSQFFVLTLVIFVSYSLIYTCGTLSQTSSLATIDPSRYLIFGLNAILTLLAYPLIYLFEKLFGVTTNLTLLELSSTNNPAMRELSRRAPGTFQHSMQVATIVEDLIGEIGGNALLAKVGALYHDIGKINDPLYFTENQNSDYNPHDSLTPIESANIITAHVTDGLKIARKYHLPDEIQDFIRTHHGTTYTGYFYAKALAEHPNHDFDESVFQYHGPRPYSRETAIVMIVDTVEAACRSLKNHTQEATDELIDRLIDAKLQGGQFDNCQLTLGDIAKIRAFLKMKMMSIYHVRVQYPTLKTT